MKTSEETVIFVSKKIEAKIKEIESLRNSLDDLAHKKALTAANYDKSITITLMRLDAGKPMELEGETISKPAKSIMEKLAKGICFQEKMDMDLADSAYKACIKKLDCIGAELNGFQSINKHLSAM